MARKGSDWRSRKRPKGPPTAKCELCEELQYLLTIFPVCTRKYRLRLRREGGQCRYMLGVKIELPGAIKR